MLQLAPPLSFRPCHPLHQTCKSKTLEEAKQLHTISLETDTFNHPSISSRIPSDRVPQRTLVSWNIILDWHVRNRYSDEAIALFRELLGEFAPNSYTLSSVIKACARSQAREEGRQIHGLVLKTGFGLDNFVQNSLVSMYSKCDRIDAGKKVFDRMVGKDLVSWNTLIDGYVRGGEMEAALKLFDEMPERDCFSWTVLVHGFSVCGKVEAAREIFDKMPNRNLVSWNALINGYMKSGNCESALQLFNQMKVKDVITWNSMIKGYESNGKPVEALELFKRMLNENVTPDDATFVSALSAVSETALLGLGRLIHSSLTKVGFRLVGALGTVLIDMYTKCGSIESAQTVFQAIPKKKLGHWSAIICGLGVHGMADAALELFTEMRRVGMRPNDITFLGMLNACSHAGLVDDGRWYFNMMVNDYGIQPSIRHYGCLVDILCRAGHIEEAKNMIVNMPMKPNKVVWVSLFSGSRRHRFKDIAEYAAQKLIELGPDTSACYVVLSSMHAAAGQWDKFSQLRDIMKKRRGRNDHECSSIELRGVLHEFVLGDKSHSQTDTIHSKIREMHEKVKLAGHVPDTSQVLSYAEDEKEKEAELENHSERLAIAYGLINMEPGIPIRVMKSFRICNDCHSVTKLLSDIYSCEIVVRDNRHFHHFKNGSCSCKDFW